MRGEKLVKANELLVKALTANLLPPALMDSAEIRELLELISNGAYIPPHRTKVTELIDAQYDMVLSKMKVLWASATSVSITTDAATMHTGDSYVAVTAHWLDAEWRIMSCVLEEIASVVKDLVNVEFMLENRLDSISTDQGANFIAAVQLLIEEGEKSTPSAYALVCLFRTITTTINNSPMLLDALKKRQHSPELLIIDSDKSGDEECSDNEEEIDPTNVLSGCKHGLKLIKDVCTRWNSTFYMLQRCVLLKEAINHVLQESKYANLIPTSEQWLAAEKLCVFLKPFQIATDFLQGEKYPTLGCVSRYITTLLDGLQSHSPPIHWQLQSSWGNLPSVVQNVRLFILKDMRARWDPTDILLDEQPSVPNKKLPLVFDAAGLEDPDGWLEDEHITSAQHLLQERALRCGRPAKYITAVDQNI
ncbi:hypothetical protein EMCRGX_G023159 [Ephydatia muelleri]